MDGLKDFLVGVLSNLLNALMTQIQELILLLFEFVVAGVNQIGLWVFGMVIWVFDTVAGFCVGYSADASRVWLDLDSGVLQWLTRVDILSVCQILLCALMVRFVLNLIPSWATRA